MFKSALNSHFFKKILLPRCYENTVICFLVKHQAEVLKSMCLFNKYFIAFGEARSKEGTGNQSKIHSLIAQIQWIKLGCLSKNFTVYEDSKPLTVWITINWGKFWKRWKYQTSWPASWETYMQVRKQQLELDMEQQTGSK